MTAALHALSALLPCGYMLSALLHGMAFGGPRAPRVEGLRRAALGATLLAHVAYLLLRALALDRFPISDVWSTLSAVALCTASLHVVISRGPAHTGTGGVVLGVVFLLQLLSSAFGPAELLARGASPGPFQILHIVTSALAAAALVVSGVHGILYLALFHRLREHRFGPLFAHLPDLEVLSRLTRSSALAGFLFLTVGVNVGIAMAHAEQSPGFRYGTPEVLISILLWVHFGVIAFSRFIRGFGARRASFAAAGGLIALLLSLVLILFPGLSFHSGL